MTNADFFVAFSDKYFLNNFSFYFISCQTFKKYDTNTV